MPRKTDADRWQNTLAQPHSSRFRWLPHAPRCSLCGVPFAGIGGRLASMAGIRPWNKNPTLCNACFQFLPKGGVEVDVAVLFADLRGSTALGEQLSPSAFAELLNRFYRLSIEVLIGYRAFIDKMIGDEVMAFFVAVSGWGYRRNAVSAAVEMMRRFREVMPDEDLPRLGIGLNAGLAYVGKVGDGNVSDFTTLGDTINTAAKLQDQAKAGEIIMSEELYRAVADEYPDLRQRQLPVAGHQDPMTVRVLDFRELTAPRVAA